MLIRVDSWFKPIPSTLIRAHSCPFVVQTNPFRPDSCSFVSIRGSKLPPSRPASPGCSKFAVPAGFSDNTVLLSRHTPAFLACVAVVNARFKKVGKHFLTSAAENDTTGAVLFPRLRRRCHRRERSTRCSVYSGSVWYLFFLREKKLLLC